MAGVTIAAMSENKETVDEALDTNLNSIEELFALVDAEVIVSEVKLGNERLVEFLTLVKTKGESDSEL